MGQVRINNVTGSDWIQSVESGSLWSLHVCSRIISVKHTRDMVSSHIPQGFQYGASDISFPNDRTMVRLTSWTVRQPVKPTLILTLPPELLNKIVEESRYPSTLAIRHSCRRTLHQDCSSKPNRDSQHLPLLLGPFGNRKMALAATTTTKMVIIQGNP